MKPSFTWTTPLTRQTVAATIPCNVQSNNNNIINRVEVEQQLRFLCRVPIVGAPMAGHAGGLLAAAVCRAGGLGFIGCGHALADNDDADKGMREMEHQIDVFRQAERQHQAAESAGMSSSPATTLTNTKTTTKTTGNSYPLCLGFIGYSTVGTATGWDRLADVLQKYQPAVVQFFAPAVTTEHNNAHGRSNVAFVQNYGALVYAQVGTVQDALQALEAGVDAIIVQGSEAGGHGLRRECGNSTLSLAAAVIAKVRGGKERAAANYLPHAATTTTTTMTTITKNIDQIPILAAGGIVDGSTMAAALALGCDGVVLGTRLCASHESMSTFKQELVDAGSCDDVGRTCTFDWIQNTYSAYPWPEPYDSVGALRNSTSRTWEGRQAELAAALKSPDDSDKDSSWIETFQNSARERNADIAPILAGQGVGLIDEIISATAIVTNISNSAADIIRNLPHRVLSS